MKYQCLLDEETATRMTWLLVTHLICQMWYIALKQYNTQIPTIIEFGFQMQKLKYKNSKI